MNLKKKFCLYKHTAPNGKSYIGITSMDPEKRWARGTKYKNNKHFWAAIQKYGWDNFNHEILVDGLLQPDAERKELELIKMLKTDNQHHGYNLRLGGNRSGQMSKQSREKMSKAKIGKKLSPEHVDAIREAKIGKKNPNYKDGKSHIKKGRKDMSGKNNPMYGVSLTGQKNGMYGKQHTESAKQKMADAARGRVCSDETRRKMSTSHANSMRPVFQFSMSGEYIKTHKSIADAGKSVGINSCGINNCCNGRQKSAGGYCWAYKDM